MARCITYPAGFFEEDFKGAYRERGQQRYGLRLLAMILLQEGKSLEEVSALLHKTAKTVRFWLDRYGSGGMEGLLGMSCGRGRKARLSAREEEELVDLIVAHSKGSQGGRLRGSDIQSLISKRYGVEYTVAGIYALAHRLNLSWITSRSIHPQSDKQAQEAFKKDVFLQGKSRSSCWG